jgi:hypothetical protein
MVVLTDGVPYHSAAYGVLNIKHEVYGLKLGTKC